MAVSQHFRCPQCGWFGEVVYRAADTDDPTIWPPRCFYCDTRMAQAPQSGDFGFDLRTDGGTNQAGQKFTINRLVPTKDGLQQVEEVIDSAHKRRQIEQDSEQRYRNGEGEPLRFRADHQNASNMDQNSFGAAGTIGGRAYDSGRAPEKTDKIGIKRHGQQRPKIPIVKGCGRSPLT